MKIEIDFNDQNKLKQLVAELEKALSVAKFALKAPTNGHSEAPIQRQEQPDALQAILDNLPASFTTRDVIEAAGEDKRATVKLWLSKAVQDGRLQIVQVGQGRRPTSYQKIALA